MAGKPGETGEERPVKGSLREALAAAGRSEPQGAAQTQDPVAPPPVPVPPQGGASATNAPTEKRLSVPSAAEAALEARGGTPADGEPTPQTRVARAPHRMSADKAARTQLVRGRAPAGQVEFHQDPVVGWLVVVGGAGLGAFRPIFEGNNTVGRASSQRIPVDFGDETISAEEQAYIRYDSVDRRFLLVPNLAKTNIVAVNDRKPTSAVELSAMDVITMGRTHLVFVPFCGAEFDWAELTEMKG